MTTIPDADEPEDDPHREVIDLQKETGPGSDFQKAMAEFDAQSFDTHRLNDVCRWVNAAERRDPIIERRLNSAERRVPVVDRRLNQHGWAITAIIVCSSQYFI